MNLGCVIQKIGGGFITADFKTEKSSKSARFHLLVIKQILHRALKRDRPITEHISP